MQWMPLKLDLLPAVTIQTDKTLELYERIAKEINNGDSRQIPKIRELQNQIRRRIDQLDQFYDHHCFDQRVALFHRLKLQLMKVLMSEVSGVTEEVQSRVKEEAVREKGAAGTIGTSSRVVNQKTQAANKTASQRSLATNKKPAPPLKQQPSKKQPPPSNPPDQIKRGPELQTLNKSDTSPSHTPKPKPKTSNLQQQIESIVAMPPPQIVFTIKMTKQEYLQFLSAKQLKR